MSEPIRSSNIDRILTDSWNYYRDNMIEDSGRPLAESDRNDLDRDRNTAEHVTYSETVAYVLLRAVLMGRDGQVSGDQDREAFERVWTWAQQNMQRSASNFETWTWTGSENGWQLASANSRHALQSNYRNALFAWRYVPSLNGDNSAGGIISYTSIPGEIDRSGYNAASDDIEIAVALYMASLRGWGEGNGAIYRQQAQAILSAAWDNYVVNVAGQPYFFAGDHFSWAGELNPSYFRPGYFRHVLTELDPAHPWHLVAESSYDIIRENGQMSLNGHRGVNLPSDWLSMSIDGELAESRVFAEEAGENFGWDSFRTLFAVAQDAAWFSSPSANEYLTNASIGPARFLADQLSSSGRMPAGFTHNGDRVRYISGIDQTRGLDHEQLAMYGGYLPFFYYGGRTAEAQSIIEHLEDQYHSGGYWGNDRYNYYDQNWVWFGLLLVNGHERSEGLIQRLSALPAPVAEMTETAAAPTISLTQIDRELGSLTSSRRPRLDPVAVNQLVSFEQLHDTIQLLAVNGYQPGSDDEQTFELFRSLNQISQGYDRNLLPFLADPREFWNNYIILLTNYASRISQEGNAYSIDDLLVIFADVRQAVDSQSLFYAANDYNRNILDLAEAQLRSQAGNREPDFYETGICLAATAINGLQNDIDPISERPAYYFIINTMTLIGDLNLRLFETTRNEDYLNRASDYYCEVIESYDGIDFEDTAIGLDLNFTDQDVAGALRFNLEHGNLTQSTYDEAGQALEHLRAVAQIKSSALIIQRSGQRSIREILDELININRTVGALNDQTGNGPDFYRTLATVIQADLLLFLADRIKYNLWPSYNGIESAIDLIPDLGGVLPEVINLNNRSITLLPVIAQLMNAAVSPDPEQRIEQLLGINDRLLGQARQLYNSVPNDFAYLFAWSQTKLLEIGVRTTDFMDHEFRYLVPFYTEPALLSQPIPADSHLGIEQNYLLALMLNSADREVEAVELLQQVLRDSSFLPSNYHLYFQVHARLKLAEIYAHRSQRGDDRTRNRNLAIEQFNEIESLLTGGRLSEARLRDLRSEPDRFLASFSLNRTQLAEMGWRPDSFLAELYHEWANLTDNSRLAEIALEYCFRSDLQYDFDTRRAFLIRRWRELRSDQDVLSTQYHRSIEDGN
ncbi:MAG: hypothetical protein JW782_00380 [Candidatus Saganbacteria bacterium]|nr:hypothetical protein [Candidatus Saganbacteria bacterium]